MRKWLKRTLLTVIVIALIGTFGLIRLHSLNNTPLEPKNFSTYNKIEIYTLGIVMSLLAYPFYPEVAKEHLMLYRPFNGKPKIIKDDFFLKSKVVRTTIEKALKSGKEQRLWWPTSSYVLSLDPDTYWEARIALAFNGGWLSVKNGQVVARIPIAYPPKAYAPLINIPYIGTLGVQEGLFHILQTEGWYHTGEAHWVAKLTDLGNGK